MTSRLVKLEGIPKNEEHGDANTNEEEDLDEIETEPKVRECNWEQFKNRYSDEECTYAVEALLSGVDLDGEMEAEQLRRLPDKERIKFVEANRTRPAPRSDASKVVDKRRVERVRINSPAVLSLLRKVTGETTWSDKPHTFLRPFEILIHFHDKMEEEFPKEEPDSADLNTIDRKGHNEIKAYLEFVKARLLPPYHKFDELNHTHRAKVEYADLWSLFRLGELIFQQDDSKTDSASKGTNNRRPTGGHPEARRLWRVYWIGSDDIDWTVDNLDQADGDLRRNTMETPDAVGVWAYYIDFDGTSYRAVARGWTITRFDDEKEVTKLEVYPVRFEKDYKSTIQELQTRGQRFRDLLQQSHPAVEHDGWTLTHDPSGNSLSHDEKSEYIDSDTIIDFQEAYQMRPLWKPGFLKGGMNVFEPDTEYDDFAIIQWSGADRSKVIRKTKEIVVDYDDVMSLDWNKFLEKDDFVVDPEVRPIETDPAKQKFTPEDLALLPARLFVYSLRQRRFVNANIANLKPLPVVSDPFNELKITDSDKSLIRSIVRDHFDKKDIQRTLQNKGTEPVEQDFIRGKGKGLVILLHGAPGVGKTATAEAVAYAHRKPLFPITCGDLGIDPIKVESTLSEIFRLANLWDCVLLLDEAEIFLSHREKKDDNLQRNALVSIFLRTLEYYPGILFLTTNRVGVLDEALNSRVHVSLHFKHLDAPQTLALFQMNLKRSTLIAKQRAANTDQPELIIKGDEITEFAMQKFHQRTDPSAPWWNGRQIRNAFQVATSLAYTDKRSEDAGWIRYLGREHFEHVLKAIENYDRYRQELFHKTDSEIAEHREERSSRGFSDNTMSTQNRPGGDRHQRRSFGRQSSSFSAASLSNRSTPERQLDPEPQGHDLRGAATPTRFMNRASLSPGYVRYEGGSSERPLYRRDYDERDPNNLAYP
ncbi:hypothetical protein BGZ61DRAFT_376742 [Ilyonectria robusta]|uniref:uncharacterized protein n=1 Tax=Ilyonectria robusta TaxID=1079257 RepID=UPI001E8DB095|nr:uncharacterized protein BGZ61DRAFT_376742 [Ilyonectria robusta]KAH8646532.1 hypothetical protein BGZ61DRAFT_376742 [Ilyonectria robusta]